MPCTSEARSLVKAIKRASGRPYRSLSKATKRSLNNARRRLSTCMTTGHHVRMSVMGGAKRSRRPTQWVAGAIAKSRKSGEFSLKASRKGLSTQDFACKVLGSPEAFDLATRRQAQFYYNINRNHQRCSSKRR